MTREEAKSTIRIMLSVTDLKTRGSMTAQMVKACHMAIEALSAEPCEDAISRQEALMALTGMNLPNDNAKLVAIFGERIRNLPSVKVEPQEWISVKEHGLPKENGKYSVTIKHDNGSREVDTDYFSIGGECWSYFKKEYVLAWMPLPSPYKGE